MNRSNQHFVVFVLTCCIAAALSANARAAVTITAATVDGGSSVIVDPGATIEACVTVNMSVAGDAWRATEWKIGDAADICENTFDYTGENTGLVECFNITAPMTPGVYNVRFRTRTADNCSGTPGGFLTLINAIIVPECEDDDGCDEDEFCDAGFCEPLPVGACCAVDACSEMTQIACEAAGNDYFGDNTECVNVNCSSCAGFCGQPAPAGCYCDELCVNFGDCCSDACEECDECTGSCCYADGSCDIRSESHCLNNGGTWTDGGVCDPNTCPQPPTGSCCAEDGSCDVTTEAECAGNWTEGEDCDPNNCPQPPTGSCCAEDGSCDVTTEAECAGNWTEGEDCDPNNCPQPPPTGSCCAPSGSCTVTTQAACAAGSAWTQGGTCSPNTCPQPEQPPSGSCCAPDGTCTETTEADCDADSSWTQDGVCSPNSCEQPEPPPGPGPLPGENPLCESCGLCCPMSATMMPMLLVGFYGLRRMRRRRNARR